MGFLSVVLKYILRICSKTFGVTLVILAFALACAFVTYNQADASFNTSTVELPSNVLSYFGSYTADILHQLFGIIGGWVVIAFICKVGYEISSESKRNLFADVCTVILSSLLICAVTRSSINGGFVGSFLYAQITKCGKESLPFIPYVIAFVLIISIYCSLRGIFEKVIEEGKKCVELFADKLSLKMERFDSKQEEGDELKVAPKIDDIVEAKSTKVSNLSKNKKFILPSTALLKKGEMVKETLTKEYLLDQSKNLMVVLNDFGIQGEITSVNPGPVVTLFELKPAAGIKSSRIISLASDIARYMSAISARVAVIPGKNALGIELPNKFRQTVFLRPLLESRNYIDSKNALPIILGRNIGGGAVITDLAKMPHLLIAGTTGSGKSVGVNAMILSLLYKMTPEQCRFIMVDPKMLELSVYNDIPHLLTPVVTDPKKAVVALKWTVKEMENRYLSMSKIGVRNIDGYNEKIKAMKANGEIISRKVQTGFDTETGLPIYEEQLLDLSPIPYIVVVVDEMADLMLVAGKEIEIAVQRLAQMARAAGIHLIMATQRPSVDVITGTIKANFPTRISFQVSSKIDSRTILGEQGAEQLLGQGDMLYLASGGHTLRVHGPFVSDSEVEAVVNALKRQGKPKYIDDILLEIEDGTDVSDGDTSAGDPLYNEALNIVRSEGKVSTSFLQRRLQIGYNRAARIVDLMEKSGVVSPANHVGKREILK